MKTAASGMMASSIEFNVDARDDFGVDVKEEPIDCQVLSSHPPHPTRADLVSDADTGSHPAMSFTEDLLKVEVKEESINSQPCASSPAFPSQHNSGMGHPSSRTEHAVAEDGGRTALEEEEDTIYIKDEPFEDMETSTANTTTFTPKPRSSGFSPPTVPCSAGARRSSPSPGGVQRLRRRLDAEYKASCERQVMHHNLRMQHAREKHQRQMKLLSLEWQAVTEYRDMLQAHRVAVHQQLSATVETCRRIREATSVIKDAFLGAE